VKQIICLLKLFEGRATILQYNTSTITASTLSTDKHRHKGITLKVIKHAMSFPVIFELYFGE